MKLFTSPKQFSEAIALVTTGSRLLGLRVFEYPRGHPRPMLSLIYLLCLYIIFYNGWLRLHVKYYVNIKLMKLEFVLYKLLKNIIIVSVLMKILLGWWHTKKFKICHKKIFEIDATLRQLGLTVSYDRIYFLTIGTAVIWLTCAFIVCTLIFCHLRINSDVFISMYFLLICMYSFTVNSINIFEFYIFARCLQIKLGLINKFLSDILTDLSKEMKVGLFQDKNVCKIINVKNYEKHVIPTNMIFQWRQPAQPQINNSMSEKCDPIVFHIEPHFPSQVKEEFQNVLQNHSQRRNNSKMTKSQKCTFLLQVIKQVHLELCKVSKIICTVLGVQVAWEIGVIIIFLIETFYKFYVGCFINEHKVADFEVETYVKLALCTLYTTQIVLLSRVCKSAAEEGNRTIEIIHTIYGCDADVDLREEIQQFGIQILQHPMTFSVFGLTLDNQVLSMILKTVTTYMVIMVEVSNTLESNNAIEYSHF